MIDCIIFCALIIGFATIVAGAAEYILNKEMESEKDKLIDEVIREIERRQRHDQKAKGTFRRYRIPCSRTSCMYIDGNCGESAMTEREGYLILSKPYITTKDVARVLGISSNQASKLLTKNDVRKIHKGAYITADFVKKFGLTEYLKRVSRYADQQILKKKIRRLIYKAN